MAQLGSLEYDHEDFTKARAGDDKLAIRFFTKAAQDGDASAEQGRPIFKEVDYIQIVVPGDRTSAVVRPMTRLDEQRFQKQYEHWKKTSEETLLQGTPLEAWGVMTLAQIEEYRYFGIRTVEHMADLRDDVCQKIMGAVALKQRAKQFLDKIKSDAPMKLMQTELEKRDNEMEAMRTALADQAAIIKELQAAQNRPKK